MNAPKYPDVEITGGFWLARLQTNARVAIYHQWEQLENTGCIDNFRISAGQMEGFRRGWFFADSDAYKWLDAAARVYARFPSKPLNTLMDGFIALLAAAQKPDGYLYTYNQILFPGVRWSNLQIEHELYCHGHLIEAGVSHSQATGEFTALVLAIKAADLLVKDFRNKGANLTPGHQEVEIALLRLHEITINEDYLVLAEHFLKQRGRDPFFPLRILQQNRQVEKRSAQVRALQSAYDHEHPDEKPPELPASNRSSKPPLIQARYLLSGLSGKYMQQHQPIHQQRVPSGHAVRFAYQQTAAARLLRLNGDQTLLPALEDSWDHMVTKRMYVSGGIGALPMIEGFGRDYELDPQYAYAETCAALGCLFWNWEMTQITAQAKYADLFEWQLYNAAGVGIGIEGQTYFYNNPLRSDGGVARKPWYRVPCCPSNISRTWADLDAYLVTHTKDQIWLHQYVTSQAQLWMQRALRMQVVSSLPYSGQVTIELDSETTGEFSLHLRVPSWAGAYRYWINDESQPPASRTPAPLPTASGYSPYGSFYLTIRRNWEPGDCIRLDFELPVRLCKTHPRVKSTRGKVALSRGPLLYCLEDIDNPGVELQHVKIDPGSLVARQRRDLLGGTWMITAATPTGEPLIAIPYYLWGNRGPSEMTVYMSVGPSGFQLIYSNQPFQT